MEEIMGQDSGTPACPVRSAAPGIPSGQARKSGLELADQARCAPRCGRPPRPGVCWSMDRAVRIGTGLQGGLRHCRAFSPRDCRRSP